MAFCTAELKKASLKKSREPLKTTRALLRACSPAISSVFFPTACGYCGATRGNRAQPTWGCIKKSLLWGGTVWLQ